MAATAFAAYGWTARAREVLLSAERGPAWEAALEHRLFVESLLMTFEGDSEEALVRANTLSKLPMPTAVPFLVERVKVLRRAVAALARAFSHQSESGDFDLLIDAGKHSPLVHWAMRYGAAVLSVDAGELGRARALIAGAPGWPTESCFSAFHREIEVELGRRARAEADRDGPAVRPRRVWRSIAGPRAPWYACLALVMAILAPAGWHLAAAQSSVGHDMESEAIGQVLARHREALMRRSGAVGVGVGQRDGKPAIVFMVVKKTPEALADLPREIEGYPLLIEEVGEVVAY